MHRTEQTPLCSQTVCKDIAGQRLGTVSAPDDREQRLTTLGTVSAPPDSEQRQT